MEEFNSSTDKVQPVFNDGIPTFILKTLIISVAFVFSANSVIPDLPKIPETERNKLIILSFVQNPYILSRLSDNEVKNGHLDSAVLYIEAAIGLLEMNGASDKSISKYQDKLNSIRKLSK